MNTIFVVYFAVVFNGLDAIVVFCHIDMALHKIAPISPPAQ
jgi:hypothetical protein